MRLGAVTVGYKMPLKLALGVRGTVAGHRLGALEGGRGIPHPPFEYSMNTRRDGTLN